MIMSRPVSTVLFGSRVGEILPTAICGPVGSPAIRRPFLTLSSFGFGLDFLHSSTYVQSVVGSGCKLGQSVPL